MGPRRDKMNPLEIETHHVWTRCVRGHRLLGFDPLTGLDHSHRREMLQGLVEYQLSTFAVDCGTDSFMENHLHGVLRNRPDIARTWAPEEIAWRWKCAWPAYDSSLGWRREPRDEEIDELLLRCRNDPGHLEWLRKNLADLSWFMARIKQPISFYANRDRKPEQRGHFWQGRYGNRRLETFADVFTGFLYNDLQHVKAGIVDRLEDSDYSAIQKQIRARAREAFQDVRQRRPTSEDDEEMAQLEQLFANCYFAPLDTNAPLMTQEDNDPPPSEFVLPSGYLHQQALSSKAQAAAVGSSVTSASISSTLSSIAATTVCPPEPASSGRETANGEGGRSVGSAPKSLRGDSRGNSGDMASDDRAEVSGGSQGATNTGVTSEDTLAAGNRTVADGTVMTQASASGSSGGTSNRTIHDRLKRKQRRRASRCSILGLGFEEYFGVLQTLAEQTVAARAGGSSSVAAARAAKAGVDDNRSNVQTTSNPSSMQYPDDCAGTNLEQVEASLSTVHRSVITFMAWAWEAAADQIQRIRQLHAPPESPRAPPETGAPRE